MNGLALVMEWPTLGYMLLGSLVGFIVGLIPGLGGAVALALLIPFTFGLPAPAALAFLLALTAVTGLTGDITATVLGVPGESTSAANVLDGYPMTKKGQAGRALGAVVSSSMIGGVFGALALLLVIPVARPLVLAFGSPEFFMLIVVGLTFIGALGSGSMVKSLIVATGGVLLSTVGLDAQAGVARFTFGHLFLWDGIGLVPVALGLFAIPELVDLGVRKGTISRVPASLTLVGEGIRDVLRRIPLTLRCSAIGVFTGALPGLGASVAQWVAYAHAVQTSPQYDEDGRPRFGQGAIEGVIGPGAVNNAKEGGGLIPMVAFGVPGGLTTALLLAAFLIHGVRPGPDMLTQHLDLTLSFVWVLVLASLLAGAASLALLKPIVRLTTLRSSLIVPPMMVLLCLGSFTGRNSFGDILLMLAFGLLGILMLQLGWPRPPLVLGLVLGGLAENYLYRSIELYGARWLLHPIVLLLMLLAAGSITYSVRQDRVARRARTDPTQSNR